ncbi:MAG: GGDEF domain-containing protein [Thermoleophilia bacterium]
MNRNHLNILLVISGILLVSIVTLVVIFELLNQANRDVHNELALKQVEELSLHLSAGEWHTISDPALLGPAARQIETTRAEIDGLLLEMEDSVSADSELLLPVENASSAYLSAIDEELRLLSQGDLTQAHVVNDTGVKAGYAQLEVAVQNASVIFSDMSSRDLRRAYAGSTITAVSAAFLISFFFWRLSHARQLNLVIETERSLLRRMSLVDDLTGLYNRRGFMTLAEQHMKTAVRDNKRPIILFTDLDDMKWINDSLGHAAGDRALVAAAGILRETFRDSDIIARMGGDEFVVFALETPGSDADSLLFRLNRNLETYNAGTSTPSRIMLSIGVAQYNPDDPASIDTLLSRADERMYAQKMKKKRVAG